VVISDAVGPIRDYSQAVLREDLMPGPLGWVGGNQYDWYDMKTYAVSKLWVLQDSVKSVVEKRRSSLGHMKGPVCGFHLRRSVVGGDRSLQLKSYYVFAK